MYNTAVSVRCTLTAVLPSYKRYKVFNFLQLQTDFFFCFFGPIWLFEQFGLLIPALEGLFFWSILVKSKKRCGCVVIGLCQ